MNITHSKLAALITAAMLSVTLTGCDGDDGHSGTPGKPGGPAADTVNELHLNITDLQVANNNAKVTVFAHNEADLPVVGLKDFQIKKAAQLIPQGFNGPGEAAQWQITGNSTGFTDHKNGHYSFDLPLEGADTSFTQRFNFIAAASTLQDGATAVPHTEYTEDLAADGSSAKLTKNIVDAKQCHSCHQPGEKLYAGHNYTDLETCVTCHNQELADKLARPALAFGHLIHNVHNSAKMYGRNLDKSAETAHALVKDNCETCHQKPTTDDAMLEEWGNWSRVPTMETCSSCHTDIDFISGYGHPAQADNSNCIACHNATMTEQIHLQPHRIQKQFIARHQLNVQMTVLPQENAAALPSSNHQVRMSITLQNDQGQPVALSTIKYIESFTNIGPNFPALAYGRHELDEQKLVIDGKPNPALTSAQLSYNKGEFVYTSKALPFGAIGTDTDTAVNMVSAAICVDSEHNATDCQQDASEFASLNAVTSYAGLSDTLHTRASSSAAIDRCIGCHGDSFEIHNAFSEHVKHAGLVINQLDDIGGCVTCHTPHGTYANGKNKGALEMKLHKTHKESASFGLIGGKCAQCHDSFNLASFEHKGPMATDAINENWEWTTTGYTSPITAVCTSCHVIGSPYVSLTEQHITQNGGYYQQGDALPSTETCLTCHKPTVTNHGAISM